MQPLPQTELGHSTSLDPGLRPYSLVSSELHDSATLSIVESGVLPDVVEYVAACVRAVLPSRRDLDREPILYEPCAKHSRAIACCPSLDIFIAATLLRSKVHMPTILGMLVLLRRLKVVLPPGMCAQNYCTLHRLFITTLILSAKSLNDRSPTNALWSKFCGGLFTKSELFSMEREMLSRLDYAVTIREEVDLLVSVSHLSVVLGVSKPLAPSKCLESPLNAVVLPTSVGLASSYSSQSSSSPCVQVINELRSSSDNCTPSLIYSSIYSSSSVSSDQSSGLFAYSYSPPKILHSASALDLPVPQPPTFSGSALFVSPVLNARSVTNGVGSPTPESHSLDFYSRPHIIMSPSSTPPSPLASSILCATRGSMRTPYKISSNGSSMSMKAPISSWMPSRQTGLMEYVVGKKRRRHGK